MGTSGVAEYEQLGFAADRVFPFMSAPPGSKAPGLTGERRSSDACRMLFVGRLDGVQKGVDLLVSALSRFPDGNWTFDFVGGYRDLVEAVTGLASTRESVRYMSVWPRQEVVEPMAAYDVLVIPSRYDGWNTIANQAISAGVAIIISDQATSHDLVGASGAGVAIPAADEEALVESMARICRSEADRAKFMTAAVKFGARIATPAMASYLIRILDHAVLGVGGRPSSDVFERR